MGTVRRVLGTSNRARRVLYSAAALIALASPGVALADAAHTPISLKTGGYNGKMNSVVGEAIYNNAFDRAIRNGDSPSVAAAKADATVRNVSANAPNKFVVEESSVWSKVGTSAVKGAVVSGVACAGTVVLGGAGVAACPIVMLGGAAINAGSTVLDLFWQDPGVTVKINPAWDGKAYAEGSDVQIGVSESGALYPDLNLPSTKQSNYARSLIASGYVEYNTFTCKEGSVWHSCVIIPVVKTNSLTGTSAKIGFPAGADNALSQLTVFSPKSMKAGNGGTFNTGGQWHTYNPNSTAASQAYCTLGSGSSNPCYDIIDDDYTSMNTAALAAQGYILAESEAIYASSASVPKVLYKPKDQGWVTLAALLNDEVMQKYKSQPLSDSAIAKIADYLYKGSPSSSDSVAYDATDPVNSSNVKKGIDDKGLTRPSVNDLGVPMTTSGGSIPLGDKQTKNITNNNQGDNVTYQGDSNYADAPSSGSGTQSGGNVTVNFGSSSSDSVVQVADNFISNPVAGLKDTLSAPFAPIANLQDKFSAGECPKLDLPAVSLWGRTLDVPEMNPFCPIMEPWRDLVGTILLLCYTFTGVGLFLRA